MILLNPRLPEQTAALYCEAWQKHGPFSQGTVGIVTSGSTGEMGSIIALSGEALAASALAVNRFLCVTPKDVWGLALPLFHVGGCAIPLRAKLSGSSVRSYLGDWDATAFYEWLVVNSVTLLSLVPTQVFDLVQLGRPAPPALRAVVVGGGRLDGSVHANALALGWPVLASYGMTECSSQIATAALGTDGRALRLLDHVEVRILESGRIALRSKALLSARISFSKNSAGDFVSTFENPVVEGWFETSDRGALLLNGELQVSGRENDVVKILGELVDLVKVREVVAQAVAALAASKPDLSGRSWVVAVPDARSGYELVAVFETHARIDSDGLVQYVNARLLPYERIARVVCIDKIPRTELGKVRDNEVLELVRRL